jgi:hypothetical protein
MIVVDDQAPQTFTPGSRIVAMPNRREHGEVDLRQAVEEGDLRLAIQA